MTEKTHPDQSFYDSLGRYLPVGTSDLMPPLLEGHSVLIKVKPARTTKFGDYRPLRDKKHKHQITINNDLNPYAFMVTLLHEIAHMHAFERHKNKVKPHGQEWKDIYSGILYPFINKDYLPDDVYRSLQAHINGPTASSCSDYTLFQALKKYNPNNNGLILLEALPEGSHFIWRNGQIFEKADKIRKRFRCIDIKTKRVWFFHPMAEIEQIL